MPTFEFTSPEGKKYRVNGPDGATKEQAFGILQQQLSGGTAAPLAPVSGAAAIPGASQEQQAVAKAGMVTPERTASDDSLLGKIAGPVDAALGAVSGVVTPLIAVPGGFIKAALQDKTSNKTVQQHAQDIAGAIQYKPATGTGEQILRGIGAVAEPLGALPTAELANLAGAAGSASRNVRAMAASNAAAQNAADVASASATGPRLRDLIRAPQQMAGVGSAEASQAAQRAARAAALPVPVKLTKGQLTRDRQQVAFERETAKQKEGAPLASNYEDQNAQFGQNLDAYAEQTGAENITPRSVGKSFVGAVTQKEKSALGRVNKLYEEARAAGEMGQPVDVTALTDWIAKNKGKDKLAPIISTIESELAQNAKVEGGGIDNLTLAQRPSRTVMSLDASEDLRQAISKLAEPGTPNVVYGKEAKSLLDAAQEGKGGDLFRQARRAYENYANEFTNRDVIDKALRTKPGTKDRAVAYEDVFNHTILNGSTDDVRHVFRVLEAHPAGADAATVAAGQQAAKDLRGAVINHIKDEMQKNLNVDSTGARTGSPAKIDAIVRELDKDGKLDVIFGKKGAEQVRDLRDVAIDIYTSPSGTVNSSNTASALMRRLDDVAAYTKATPVLGKVVKYTTDQIQSANTRRKVNAALNPSLKDMAGKEGK